jgi:hypothetical protein
VLVGQVVQRWGEPSGIIAFDPRSFPKRGTHAGGQAPGVWPPRQSRPLPGRVAYLLAADIVSRLSSFRLSDDNQPVIMTRNRFSTSRSSLLACIGAHASHSTPRSSTGILF